MFTRAPLCLSTGLEGNGLMPEGPFTYKLKIQYASCGCRGKVVFVQNFIKAQALCSGS